MKLFTIEEFNQMTPYVDRVCVSIIETWAKIVAGRNKLKSLEESGRCADLTDDERQFIQKEYDTLREDLNALIDKVNGYIKEIEMLGGNVMEMKRGFVVFPFEYNGYRKFICYNLKDMGAEYYINSDETPAERKRII